MTATDITDVPRKNVLLTGPTRGLGRATALDLARGGHRLILMGRPSAAFEAIVAETRSAGAASVHQIPADFASIASIHFAVAAARAALGSELIDVVIANAGVQFDTCQSASVDGIETTFAVNVVANHVLLHGLLATLAPNAHVVVVGSGTHYGEAPATLLVPAPAWDTPAVLATPGGAAATRKRSGPRAYATSKLGVNYLVHEWQRRFGDRARFNVYDPGLMPGTGLIRNTSAIRAVAWRYVMPALVILPGVTTPQRSARALSHFALGLDHHQLAGGYVEIAKESTASKQSFDPERELELWDYLSGVTTPQ
jgi:NAD(P)-dependent dehydrogenase (short-subunit alcohol dehydrogenase family)